MKMYNIRLFWSCGKVNYVLRSSSTECDDPMNASDYTLKQARELVIQWRYIYHIDYAIIVESQKKMVNDLNDLVLM